MLVHVDRYSFVKVPLKYHEPKINKFRYPYLTWTTPKWVNSEITFSISGHDRSVVAIVVRQKEMALLSQYRTIAKV